MLGILLVSIVVLLNSFQKKEKVSAHPTSSINLGSGNTEFKVPIDAVDLEEQALKELTTQFDGYVQQPGETIPILTKENVEAFWSESIDKGGRLQGVGWSVKDVQQTIEGNYFVLLGGSGTGVGGIIGVCVINPSGVCIYKDMQGDLNSTVDRVDTKLYSIDNGTNFLVGTSGGSNYYKYMLDETTDPISVTREKVTVNGNNKPQTTLGVGYLTIADSSSNNNRQTSIAGTVYFDNRNAYNANPCLRFRVPIATMSINGWNNVNPSFTHSTQYEYSLENYIPAGANNPVGNASYGYLDVISTTITENHVYGVYQYFAGSQGGETQRTFQIFDKNDIDNSNGRPMIRRKVLYNSTRQSNGKLHVVEELCTEDEVYIFSTEETESKLIRIELGGQYTQETVKVYPRDTVLNFVKNPDDQTKVFYFGSTSSLQGEFEHRVLSTTIQGNSFYVQGVLDQNFDRQSLYAFTIDGTISPDFMKQGNGGALIFGRTISTNNLFVDEHHKIGETGTITSTDEEPGEICLEAFMGFVKAKDDYPPVIKAEKSISLDITDVDLRNTDKNTFNWTCLDNWLITGRKNGTLADSSNDDAVRVYDTMDSENTSLGQEWIEMRINRNPRDIDADIEWSKLGFDIDEVGPQRVTYFITDSESQTTTTSRWINAKTFQTIETDDYALDAQNFHIPLTGIDAAIPEAFKVEKFKELAKTKAWNTEDHDENTGDQGYGLDEDGTDSNKISGKVEIDEDQLDVLRNAKVAKPYPVDVTYKPENGVSLTNRVWVFVTTTNTLPNNENDSPEDTNGMVFYADDYSIPFRLRGGHNAQNVRERGNVRVYDYFDTTHETDSTLDNGELPTLADSTKNPEDLNVRLINEIQGALSPGVVPQIVEYVWKENTDNHHTKDVAMTGHLNVTLTGDALLHVRQVVLNPSAKLVIPQEGYVKIENRLLGQVDTEPTYQTNKIINTQEQADSLSFTTFAVSVDHLANDEDEILLSLVVPENYHYVGQFVSHGISDPNGQSHDQGHQSLALGQAIIDKGTIISPLENSEFWITFYIKPNEDDAGNQKAIQPYSWDYKKNDLGKIKTK